MMRRKVCIGVGLSAFGAGLILAVMLQSGVCVIVTGLVCIAAGIICING